VTSVRFRGGADLHTDSVVRVGINTRPDPRIGPDDRETEALARMSTFSG